MKAFDPTDEQKAILKAEERLVIVRACPGSGKTAVFAEKVKQLASQWPHSRKGIAALSFTNSASREIYERVGGSLVSPHFIGTLDSFILRYVVLPFGHLIGLPRTGARLMPAPMDERMKFSPFKYGQTARETVPICSIKIVGGSVAKPIMEFFDPIKKSRATVKDSLITDAVKMKRKNWASNGIITHADSHYIAAELLTVHEKKEMIAETIARRFPTILVDEFQDTMSFLSQALLSLLDTRTVSGLVVGDPDQAIYEFGGAPGNLFDRVEQLTDAKGYPMDTTQRFGKNIAAVVSVLSDSNRKIESAPGLQDGLAVLVVHKFKNTELTPDIAKALIEKVSLPNDTVVLSRNARICMRLSPLAFVDSFPGGSQLASQIDRAVFFLRSGENIRATNIISRELWSFLTDKDSLPTKQDLHNLGIERKDWRRIIYSILIEADRLVENETWSGWLIRVKNAFEKALEGLGKTQKVGASFRTDDKCSGVRGIPPSQEKYTHRVLTVHQAKGAQFENVLVFIGKPHARYSPCISSQWWGNSSGEEKRVGFVALSRSKSTLVLCVHDDTFKSLKASQAAFVGLFNKTIIL
ncbi:MAG: ATP-dependent helicase [Candidatus Melainabacteria bacterium]|nr:ATP-dependent helicase [Candidatus Melainabacteria bacterium]